MEGARHEALRKPSINDEPIGPRQRRDPDGIEELALDVQDAHWKPPPFGPSRLGLAQCLRRALGARQ